MNETMDQPFVSPCKSDDFRSGRICDDVSWISTSADEQDYGYYVGARNDCIKVLILPRTYYYLNIAGVSLCRIDD